MTTYLVFRQQGGTAWKQGRPLEEQDQWPEHAKFMTALEDEGVVQLGGPFGARGEVLLVMQAEDVAKIHARLAGDPWTASGQLTTTRIEAWTIRLGHLPLGRAS